MIIIIKKEWVLSSNVHAKALLPHNKNNSPVPHVTIWIHGTHFWFNKLSKIIRTQPEGLYHISTIPHNYLYRWLIAEKLSSLSPQDFPIEHFHFFCWSGKLSFEKRYDSAKILADNLNHLRSDYVKKYGLPPYVTLITHSHGGNVALNLATQKCTVPIDRLILLAIPVQEQTAHYVDTPFFKKIYSFYSTHDFIQMSDPQGIYTKKNAKKEPHQKIPLFSKRTFSHSSSHLVQARVKFKGLGPFHMSYFFTTFLSSLELMIQKMDEARERNCHHLSFKIEKGKIIDVHDKKLNKKP